MSNLRSALATALLLAVPAHAAPEPLVAQVSLAPQPAQNSRSGAMLLSLQTCAAPGFDVARFRDAFANELRDMGAVSLHALDTPSLEGLNVLAEAHLEELACGAPTRAVAVQLVDRLTHKTLARGVALTGVDAAARPRLLALSAIELLRASWLELEQQERRQVVEQVVRLGREVRVTMRAALPPPSATPATNANHESNYWSIGVQGTVAQWASYRASMAGVELPLSQETPHARFFAAPGVALGHSVDALGEITMNAVHLTIGADMQPREKRARDGEGAAALRMGVGPRVDVGHVFLSAQPAPGASASSGSAWMMSAALGMTLSANASPSLTLRAGLDGGVMLVSARALAAERLAVGISGPYVALKFGAAYSL